MDRALPQGPEPRRHGQHPLELAVGVDLVAAEPLQPVRIGHLAEGLMADQGKFGRREGRFRVLTGP
jgi:hypothetical protein